MVGMDDNPYESPSKLIDAVPSPFLGIGFKVVAVAVWLFDVLLIMGCWTALTHPVNVQRRLDRPTFFYGLVAAALILPVLGIAFIGAAAWFRSWRILGGGLLTFLPIGAYVIYHMAT
jgi:hypothetical protein